jgi:tetratricopeptide (TPR) repeat protein
MLPNSYDLIYIYRNSDDLSSASKLIEQLETNDTNDVRLSIEKAKILMSKGQFQESDEIYHDIKQDSFNNKNYWKSVYEFRKVNSDRKGLIESLEMLTFLEKTNIDYMDELLDLYRLEQNTTKRIPLLERLIEIQPGSPHYREEIGQLKLNMGDYIDAITHMKHYLKIAPDDFQMATTLIETLKFVGLNDEAIKISEKFTIAHTTSDYELLQLIKIMYEQERYKAADDVYKQLIEQQTGYTTLITFSEGLIYEKDKNALYPYKWLNKTYPKDNRVTIGYIKSLIENQKHKKALALYKKRFYKQFKFDRYHAQLKDLYYLQTEDTERFNETLSELELLFQSKKSIESGLVLLEFYELKGLTSNNKETLSILMKKAPKNPIIYDLYMAEIFKENDPEIAIAEMEKYLSHHPQKEIYRQELASYYFWNQEYEKTKQHLLFLPYEDSSDLTYMMTICNTYINEIPAALTGYQSLMDYNYSEQDYIYDYLYTINQLSPSENQQPYLENLNTFLSKENIAVLEQLLSIYQEFGTSENIKEIELTLLKVAPTAARYIDLAWQAYNTNNIEKAYQYFNEAYNLDPKNSSILPPYFKLAFQLKKPEAAALLDRYVTIAPETASSFYAISEMYNSFGKNRKERKYLKKYLKTLNNELPEFEDPLFLETVERRAYANFTIGKKDKTLTQLRELINQHPAVLSFFDLYFYYIGALENNQKMIPLLEEYLSTFPNDNTRRLELVYLYLWEQNYNHSLRHFEQLTEKEDTSDIIYLTSILNAHTGSPTEAINGFNLLFDIDESIPTFTYDYMIAIQELTTTNDRLVALLDLNSFTEEKNIDVLSKLSTIYRELKLFEMMRKTQNKLIQLSPSAAQYAEIAWDYFDKKNIKDSHTYFKQAYVLDPNYIPGLSGLTQTAKIENDPDFETYLNKYSSIATNDPNTIYMFANFYSELGRKKKSKRFYKKYLSLLPAIIPSKIDVLEKRITALNYLGKQNESRQLLKHGHSTFPTHLFFIYSLLDDYSKSKKYKPALKLLKNLPKDEVWPLSFQETLRAYDYYLNLELKNFSAAEDALWTLIEFDGKNFSYKTDMLYLLLSQSKWKEGLNYIQVMTNSTKKDSVKKQLFRYEKDILEKYGTKSKITSHYLSKSTYNLTQLYGEHHHWLNKKNVLDTNWSLGNYPDVNSSGDTEYHSLHGRLKSSIRHFHPNNQTTTTWIEFLSSPVNTFSAGLTGSYKLKKSTILIDVAKNNSWIDPIQALYDRGVYDWVRTIITIPLIKKVYVRVSAGFKSFRTNLTDYFGSESQESISIGRPIYEAEEISTANLRYASMEIGYSGTSITQEETADFSIEGRSDLMYASLYTYFSLSPKSDFELSTTIGGDFSRGIDFGNYYGITGKYSYKVSPRKYFVFQSEYSSETPLGQESGTNFSMKAGLQFNF